MKTEKLYYIDAYLSDFTARVVSCEKCDEGWWIVLDKTAFFPEEGGQSADNGYIAGVYVKTVEESESIIRHLCDKPLPVGESVRCKIDFDARLEKMQCHTAEHIVCGLFHTFYGYDNVGFHLGQDYVTFDINAYVDRNTLDEIETLANKVVFENVEVLTFFPNADEISAMEYRSKIDILDNVRIVKIGSYDTCACCAPHVSRTGEIGLIKLLNFEKHRGGTRIFLAAGKRALMDYRDKYTYVKRISELTCAPQHEVSQAVEKLSLDFEKLKTELQTVKLKNAAFLGQSLEKTNGNAVVLLPDFSADELREYSNRALENVRGVLVALSGCDGDYKYVISSKEVNLRQYASEFNSILSGKGGGRPEMLQGSFAARFEEIKEYFSEKQFS